MKSVEMVLSMLETTMLLRLTDEDVRRPFNGKVAAVLLSLVFEERKIFLFLCSNSVSSFAQFHVWMQKYYYYLNYIYLNH